MDDGGAAAALGPLARVLKARLQEREEQAARAAEEHCELCTDLLPEIHPHLVNLQTRALLCACKPCSFLFSVRGASPRFRTIPEDYRRLAELVLEPWQWDALQIPVGLVFVFFNTALDRTVAFYPSPAGPTESLLDLESWRDVVAANPPIADLEPDVEAVLLRRHEDGTFEGWRVPIDACYELVGLVRMHWKGFDGGSECWAAINGFFESLPVRARERRP